MIDMKIIKDVIEYSSYYNSSIFEAIIKIGEDKNLDVEDITKMLDDNLLLQLRQECIKDRRVMGLQKSNKVNIDNFF